MTETQIPTPRQQPHSIEAEQALLGAILCNGDALDAIDGIVSAQDFFEPIHRELFDGFLSARNEGRRISWQLANALLSPALKGADIGGLTGAQYVARLATEAVTVINAYDFARVIADHADRRRIIAAAETMEMDAYSAVAPPASLAIDGMGELDSIALRHVAPHVAAVTFGQSADRTIANMQEAMQRGGKLTGIPSCLADLDRKINGWQRGDYILLAGRPGMGKSGLIISCLRQSAERGFNSILFSQEMSAEAVTDRMLSDACYHSRAPITYFDIARGGVTNEQAEAVINANRAMRELPIRIDPQGGLTMAQIAARARRHKQHLERKGKTLDLGPVFS